MIPSNALLDLDNRARDIFRHIVESYMQSGIPVGSRTVSRNFDVSPATIRNVMADLEDLGLLHAPHTSAGRLPTQFGLRCFLDGILELGNLTETERAAIEEEFSDSSQSMSDILDQASRTLSGLSASAGLVIAPKAEKNIKHIEFVSLDSHRALVILVPEDGMVENRVMELPPGITPDILKKASMFLSERLYGKTMQDMRAALLEEIEARRSELGVLMTEAVKAGLAIESGDGNLIVRGQANLLNETDLQNLEQIRKLLEQLESKETVSKLVEEATKADGVKIFIGAENPIFEASAFSMIIRPYQNANKSIVGAIGVIGPTRLDYAKIIPSVDYTAEIISRYFRSSES